MENSIYNIPYVDESQVMLDKPIGIFKISNLRKYQNSKILIKILRFW
jgi:hypothetical protein